MTKRVAIVAMGNSRNDFLMGRLLPGFSEVLEDSEIWAINYMAHAIRCDKLFAMDPLDDPAWDSAPSGYIKYLKESQLPIISSKKVEGFNITEYPLQDVTERVTGGFQYFNNTVPYALAYAIYIGAEEILLFGCDYTYADDPHGAESGRACLEFWLGVAVTRGVRIVVAGTSSLLDQNIDRKLYGYVGEKDANDQSINHA